MAYDNNKNCYDFYIFHSILLTCLLLTTSAKALNNPYCSLTCELGDSVVPHTVCNREKENCGPNEKCGPDFKIIEMNDDWRQIVLDLHNELRNNVASGNETRNDQPSATNMNLLKYNKELEFIAQCWINDCNGNPLKHDKCRTTKKFYHVGQNLGFINSSAPEIDYKETMKELIMYWYNEVSVFPNEWVNYTDDRGPDIKVGHYTQMMWANTTDLGCAGTYYTSIENNRTWHYYLFGCNYGPGGNFISFPVYDIGIPCMECDSDNTCNTDYEALCGVTIAVNETVDNFVPLFQL